MLLALSDDRLVKYCLQNFASLRASKMTQRPAPPTAVRRLHSEALARTADKARLSPKDTVHHKTTHLTIAARRQAASKTKQNNGAALTYKLAASFYRAVPGTAHQLPSATEHCDSNHGPFSPIHSLQICLASRTDAQKVTRG